MNLPARPEKPIKIYHTDEDWVLYHHVDGMYSYCTIIDKNDPDGDNQGVCHLSVGTPLEEYKDGYRIREQDDE